MLDHLPDETTALLVDLCTTALAPPPPPLAPGEHDYADNDMTTQHATARQPSVGGVGGGAGYLSYLALNRGSTSSTAPSDATAPPPSTASTATTVKATDHRAPPRREGSSSATDAGTIAVTASSGSNSPPSVPSRSETPTTLPARRGVPVKQRPSPRVYFAHFIDHPAHFLRFLEAVAARRWGQSVDASTTAVVVETEPATDPPAEARDQAAVWNTLLELYLSDPGTTDKALAVLRRDGDLPYDATHALVLCSTRGFTPGLVLLWEKLGMHEDVLRFHMDRARDEDGGSEDASDEVVRGLARYGGARPGLYPLVLRFLTSTPALLARHTQDLGRILEHIEREKIMPPLAVVQVLSRNDVASVGLVKQWLLSRIKASREEIDLVRLTVLLPLLGCSHFPCRTSSLRRRTGRRRQRSCGRSPSSRTRTRPGCSTSRSARRAAASSTCRACTSSARTPTTSAASASTRTSARTARARTASSARSGGTTPGSRTRTTCSSER